MRWSLAFIVGGLVVLACAQSEPVETTDHLNPMIPLLEEGLPVFGIAHPSYTAGRGGRGGRAGRGGRGGGAGSGQAEPPPPLDLAEVAREFVSYQLDDFALNSFSPNSVEQYRAFLEEIVAAGGSVRTHPFFAKIPIVHRDPEAATQRLIEQLNEGQIAVAMQEVETVEEVNQTLAAMRFTSQGGVRPESGFERAAAYWGLTEAEYLAKADVWPVNPEGELLLTVIIESEAGVANARAIAALPAVSVVTVGAGTLGGVFTSTNEEGERVRDQEGFDTAVATVLAACKEFNKACGYPANNPEEVEALMADGWDFLIMQRRNQDAFDAVVTGRRLGGRPIQTP